MNLPARDPEVLLTYDGFVRALARSLVRDDHRADDVVQQAWLTALERGPSNARSVHAWLGSLVRNLAAKVRRAESRRSRHEMAAARNEAAPSTEEILEREAARRSVVRAVLGLEEPYRSTVLLRYFDNLAPRAIAQRLGVPVETVRTRSKRALEQLRARLDREHGRGRRAWAVGLLPLASLPPAVPTATPWSAALQRAFIQGVVLVSTQMKFALPGAALLAASITVWALGLWPGPDVPDTTSRVDDAAAAATGKRGSAPGSELAPQQVAARRAESVPTSRSAATDSFGSLLVRLVWADKSPAAEIGARVYAWGGPEPKLQHLESVSGSDGTLELAAVHAGRVTVTADRGGTASAMVEPGKRAEITVEIPVGLAVTGTVVDAAERPVPGAEIWLAEAWPDLGQGRIVARAGADGSFHIRDVEQARVVDARAPGFAPAVGQFLFGNPGGRVAVRLELSFPGGEVAGVVLDPRGQPVDSGTVIVRAPRTRAHFVQLRDGTHPAGPATLRERVDHDGRFRVRAVPTGAVPIEVRGPGFAPWTGSVEVSAAACAFLEVRLAEGVTLSGTVRDARGEPVPEVEVRVSVGEGESRMVITGERGNFRLPGLAPGEIRAEADGAAKGSAARTFTAATPGQELCWDAVLAVGLPIRGRVLEPDDAPLAGWSVVVLPPGWPVVSPLTAVTDAQGRFVVANCKDAAHKLEVRAPQGGSFPVHSRSDVRPGGEEIVIRIPAATRPSAFIEGVLVDREEQPVCGARVLPGGPGRFDGLFGALTEEGTGRFRIGPVPPGRYTLSVSARGFGDLYFEHTLAAGETWDLGTIRLLPPGTLSATVRTVAGSVPPSGSVWLRMHVSGGQLRGHVLLANGQGQMPALPPGSYFLQVGGKGFSCDVIPCEVRSGEDTKVEVVVRPGVTKTIRLELSNAGPGQQLDGTQLVVREASGKRVLDMVLWASGTEPFTWDWCLAPGEYRLEASTRSGARGAAVFRVDARDTAEPVVVELR